MIFCLGLEAKWRKQKSETPLVGFVTRCSTLVLARVGEISWDDVGVEWRGFVEEFDNLWKSVEFYEFGSFHMEC